MENDQLPIALDLSPARVGARPLIQEVRVATLNEYLKACEALTGVRAYMEKVEKEISALRQPLLQESKRLIRAGELFLADLRNYEIALKAALFEFDKKRDLEREEEQTQLEDRLREREAKRLISLNDMEMAEKVLNGEGSLAIPVLSPPASIPESGIFYRKRWQPVIVDKMSLVGWLIKNNMEDLITINLRLLAKKCVPSLSRNQSAEPQEIPGISWEKNKTLVQRFK